MFSLKTYDGICHVCGAENTLRSGFLSTSSTRDASGAERLVIPCSPDNDVPAPRHSRTETRAAYLRGYSREQVIDANRNWATPADRAAVLAAMFPEVASC